ncbi:MAG: hypothetical protein ACI87J_002106 [Colwellia sp.]
MTKIIFGKKYTFYNTKVAINFQAVISQGQFNTINIEMASKDKAGNVDWQNTKISLQLSETDAFKIFYCIINNKPLRYQSKFHGEKNRKSISFEENTEGGCKITVKDNGHTLYYTVSLGEWFYGKLLLTEQLLGLPISFEDTKKLMAIPTSPSAVK